MECEHPMHSSFVHIFVLCWLLQVGGRSVVNSDIAQFVEIRPEADRFLRLLEVLGEWYEAGKIIIFVHTQDNCDNLFRDLLKVRG
jgi:ATP-dependent RNA helicase DDX46/PRP5